jgi:6-pyruvoyltetrahydropterin/6-carboxytetrahydropterin synthase
MIEIENGHILSKHPDKCRFPHGHSRKIELTVEAETLDANGMVCDFKVLKGIMESFAMRWDHALCMNTEDKNYKALREMYGERIIPFDGMEPTTEVMAKVLFDVLNSRLKEYSESPDDPNYVVQKNARVVKVRLWETSSSWAEYEA